MGSFDKIGDSFNEDKSFSGNSTGFSGLLLEDGVASGGSGGGGFWSRGGGSYGDGSWRDPEEYEGSGEYPDITEWAIKQGLDLAYDLYGKPIITDAVLDAYMYTFGNAERYTRDDGTTGFRDVETGDEISKDTAAGAKAAAAAAGAGITSLWNSYLKDGEISDKDWQQAAADSTIAGGAEYAQTQFGDSAGSSAGIAGLASGAGSVVSQYIYNDGEVDWGEAGKATLEGAGEDYASNSLGSFFEGASADSGTDGSGGAEMGSAVAKAGKYWLDLQTSQDDYTDYHDARSSQKFLGMMGSVAGSTVAGPIGGMVGGAAGSGFGAMQDISEGYTYTYGGNGLPVQWDAASGQFVSNEVTGANQYTTVNGVSTNNGLSGDELDGAIFNQQAQNDLEAANLNENLNNIDSLSMQSQQELQSMIDGTYEVSYATWRNSEGQVIDATPAPFQISEKAELYDPKSQYDDYKYLNTSGELQEDGWTYESKDASTLPIPPGDPNPNTPDAFLGWQELRDRNDVRGQLDYQNQKDAAYSDRLGDAWTTGPGAQNHEVEGGYTSKAPSIGEQLWKDFDEQATYIQDRQSKGKTLTDSQKKYLQDVQELKDLRDADIEKYGFDPTDENAADYALNQAMVDNEGEFGEAPSWWNAGMLSSNLASDDLKDKMNDVSNSTSGYDYDSSDPLGYGSDGI